MTRLLVATSNRDKLREIRGVLANVPIELVTLADLPAVLEPDETGRTFQENARLKASYYARHSRLVTVAEDSGLVIDGLDGDPGVRSARFVRPDASYPERFNEIYRRFQINPDASRGARFVCALAVVDDQQVVFETTGTVEGEIAAEPRGTNGFGYDPIFYFPPYNSTFGEVSEEAKLRVAHRGHAFRQLATWLRERKG